MSGKKIALSQAELDKLMGVQSSTVEEESKEIDTGRLQVKEIATSKELEAFKKLFTKGVEEFKKLLKKQYEEPKSRKLIVSNVELIKASDFAKELTLPAFIYKIELDESFVIIKLDAYLFSAMAGLTIDRRNKPNKFQAVVLRDQLVPLIVESFFMGAKQNFDMSMIKISIIKSSELKNIEEVKNNKTGVLTTVNWNENFDSFGVEKVFISKQLFAKIQEKKWF